MRDPARIDRILAAVREVWTEYPDLRLGQLIVNAIRPSRPCPQVFYPEDSVVEAGLVKYPDGDRPFYTTGEKTLELSRSEAIVLVAILIRYRDADRLVVEHAAEAQVLYDVCELLERQLGDELTDPGWRALLDDARRDVERGEA